jgi:D-amino peptidase
MEGASGLFRREQTWYWEASSSAEDDAAGKALLMADVDAVSEAALGAGADELIICDTHHGGGNIDPERMLKDPRITYVLPRGRQDGKLRWMPGLDESVDAIFLPGHHAKAGTDGSFMHHTWSSDWADFQINGQSVGEMGIEACFAGHWGVPLAFVQGDEAACAEAREQFPWAVAACVKRAVSYGLAEGLDPAAARKLTAEKAAEAVEKVRRREVRPFQPDLPMTITVRLKSPEAARKALSRPGVEARQIDDCTLEGRVERRADVVMWLLGTGLDMVERQ